MIIHDFRKNLLKIIIPEIVWPKEVMIDNVKIKLRGTPYFFGEKLGIKLGDYEAAERNLIRDYDLKDDIVIEMGGSLGILTAILAEKVGESGRVISVEASKNIADYSRLWLEKKPRIKVITGYAFPVFQLNINIEIIDFKESANNLVGEVIFKVNNNGDKKNQLVYDINRLSILYNLKPTILVADIEGSEKILIEQPPNFPESIRLILIELHPELYGEKIRSQICEIIKNEGFKLVKKENEVYLFNRV